MTETSGVWDLVVLLLAALTPAILYLSWIRRTERYLTEAWRPLLGAFAFGAVAATLLAIFIEGILIGAGTAISEANPGLEFSFLNAGSSIGLFFLVLVVAPITEEAVKAWGVTTRAEQFRIPADGPVFGASVGLGFGFFETLVYGITAYFLLGGLLAGLAIIFLRSLSTVLLHASTAAIFGNGYAQGRFFGVPFAAGRHYLLAVLMHATFNALASVGIILSVLGASDTAVAAASVVALVLAMGFAFAAIEYARALIQRGDYPATSGPRAGVRPQALPSKPPSRGKAPPTGYRG